MYIQICLCIGVLIHDLGITVDALTLRLVLTFLSLLGWLHIFVLTNRFLVAIGGA